MHIRFSSSSVTTTARFANLLAPLLRNSKIPLCIALIGPLGSGKTTFTRYITRSLASRSRVSSPSFVLWKTYAAKNLTIDHLDCYRMKKGSELASLGIADRMNKKGHLVLIEWANRARRYLPEDRLEISFTHTSRLNVRRLDARATGPKSKKLLSQWQTKLLTLSPHILTASRTTKR